MKQSCSCSCKKGQEFQGVGKHVECYFVHGRSKLLRSVPGATNLGTCYFLIWNTNIGNGSSSRCIVKAFYGKQTKFQTANEEWG